MEKLNKAENDPRRIERAWGRLQASSKQYGKLAASTAKTFLEFIYTIEAMSAYLSHKTRAKGLTRAGLNVLTILRSTEGKGCQHNQISRLLLVTRANVTGLVNSLIKQGLVERVYDEKDRRVCIARITKKGDALLDSFLPDYHAAIENIFSGLSAEDKKTFNHLMVNLRDAINGPKNKRSI